mgnify:CR=1 FL=1
MKSISLFLILFIVPIAISNLDKFSIDPFINNLKNEGLYDLISSIKDNYGEDVAIISCEELNKNHSGNCRTLVKDYIPSSSPNPDDDTISKSNKKIIQNYFPNIIFKNEREKKIKNAIKDIKEKKYNKNDLIKFIKKLKL